MEQGHFSFPAEGFKGHVAPDGSLLGTAGKWGACGWSVVQLDCVADLGPLHGKYGPMEAEFEVQRTIKTAELTAFLCPLKMHVDNKGVIDGPWRGERRCSDPKASDAHLWIKIWEELQVLMSKDFLVEVEPHKEGKERNVATDGNEKADELAKAGAMSDGGLWGKREQRQSSRSEKRCAQPCSTQQAFTVWWKKGKTVKSSSRSQKKSGFSWKR